MLGRNIAGVGGASKNDRWPGRGFGPGPYPDRPREADLGVAMVLRSSGPGDRRDDALRSIRGALDPSANEISQSRDDRGQVMIDRGPHCERRRIVSV